MHFPAFQLSTRIQNLPVHHRLPTGLDVNRGFNESDNAGMALAGRCAMVSTFFTSARSPFISTIKLSALARKSYPVASSFPVCGKALASLTSCRHRYRLRARDRSGIRASSGLIMPSAIAPTVRAATMVGWAKSAAHEDRAVHGQGTGILGFLSDERLADRIQARLHRHRRLVRHRQYGGKSEAGISDHFKLVVSHEGSGQPWATVQVLAAIQDGPARNAGYRISRKLTPIQEKVAGKISRGDLWRVTLTVDADNDMSWVALTDPVPAGARIMGDGDGHDSSIAGLGESEDRAARRPTYVERSFSAYRAYYAMLPKGRFTIDYTLRLNNVGTLGLPPTRIEAMYAPDVFGEMPNARVVVGD